MIHIYNINSHCFEIYTMKQQTNTVCLFYYTKNVTGKKAELVKQQNGETGGTAHAD